MQKKHTASGSSGFATLTIIAIIVAVLLITGIGQAMWRNTTQLGAHCRNMVLEWNIQTALDICDSVGESIVSFQRYLEQKVGASSFGDTMNLEEYAGYLAREFSSSTIGFSAPQLSGLINPRLLNSTSDINWQSASPMDRLSLALTQGAQGSSLLNQGHTQQGLGYLHSSASMGDAGLLSQLQLGSTYARGTNGVQADPARANYYYEQAIGSIDSLQRSNTPASKQLLQALPASASSMKTQLQTVLSNTPH